MLVLSLVGTGCARDATGTGVLSDDGASETQHIYYVMPPAPIDGDSVIDFTRQLKAGERVSGYIIITGLWEVEGDYCTPWSFQAFDPAGNMIDTATLNPDIINQTPHYDFDFTTSSGGAYTIRAIHFSLYTRDLNMEISPAGWQATMAPDSSALGGG